MLNDRAALYIYDNILLLYTGAPLIYLKNVITYFKAVEMIDFAII